MIPQFKVARKPKTIPVILSTQTTLAVVDRMVVFFVHTGGAPALFAYEEVLRA